MSNFAEQTEHTLFASLGAGARFDRRRFGSDFRLFGAAASPGDAADRRTSGEASSSQASQASSVDFFGGGSLPTVNVSGRVGDQDKKTRKRRQSQVDEEATEDVVDEDDASGDEVADTPLADDDADDLDDIGPLDTIEKVQQFRNRLRIRATGNDVPVPVRTFAEFCDRFKVARYLAANLAANKYVRPTPIQMQAMPVIADGREVLGSAATGSGKTLAYLLPILQSLGAPSTAGLRVVIVVPTRELSQQIYRHVKRLTAGRNFRLCVLTKATASTTASLGSAAKFDILITTPMRLVHLVRNRSVDLTHVQHLVLDEGDKLLEMGFLQQVDEILAACTHPKLCRHLFSATMPPTIEDLARSFMRDPVRIVVGQRNSAASSVRQRLMYVGSEDGKLLALRQLTLQGLRPPVLIFVQSKERAKDLFHELVYDGINVDVIHAERTQLQRDTIVEQFRAGRIWFLISTELMGRGMDFKGVNVVINYDFPPSVTSYIHQIGRAGRAGRSGEAVTLFTDADAPLLRSVAHVIKDSGSEVPDWMLAVKGANRKERRRLARTAIERRDIAPTPSFVRKERAHKRQIVEQSRKRPKFGDDE